MSNNFYFIVYQNIPQGTQKANFNTLNYIKKFLKKGDKLYFVDARKINFLENKKNIYKFKVKNVDQIKINNISEFLNILKSGSFCTTDLNYNFRSYLLFNLIKKKKLKLILFNNIGYYSQVSNIQKNNNIFHKFNLIFSKLLFKILILLSILPRVDKYFETSEIRIKTLENSISRNFQKIFRIKNLFYFDKIIRINSKYYDDVLGRKLKKNKNHILYVDNGFDHPDRIIRDGKPLDEERKKYFSQLSKFLFMLKTKYKAKIIFCHHPKSYKYPKNHYFYKYFNFCQFSSNTDKYFDTSRIVVFQISSLINRAILLKKNIILTRSDLLGNYFNEKFQDINNIINLCKVDLSKLENLNLKLLNLKIINQVKLYNNFIKKNHIKLENIKSYDQIKKNLYN